MAALLFPTLVFWAATFAYFGATGRGGIFYFTVFEYGPRYVSEGARFTGEYSLMRRLGMPQVMLLWPLAALCLTGFGLGLLRKEREVSSFGSVLLLYATGVFIAILLPRQFSVHYYQFWLPTLCIAAGLGLRQMRHHFARPAGSLALAVIATALLFASQWPNWRLSPDEFSTQKYGADTFVSIRTLAREIDLNLLPTETLYQYGYDSGFYFEAKRRPPTGVLCLGLSSVPTLPDWFLERIVADLEREKPEMVIIDTTFHPNLVKNYVGREYAIVKGDLNTKTFHILARHGGALLRRLRPTPR
jgi:hypothetical protein